MNIRTIGVVAVLALAGLASAQFVEGARGRGEVTNRENAKGTFSFNAARFLRNNEEVVNGMVEFGTRSRERAVTIQGRVQRLAVNGERKVAEFAGEGVLIVRTPRGVERVQGRFQARAVDRRQNGQGDPDVFSILFEGPNNVRFEFGGNVTRGEVTVKPRA